MREYSYAPQEPGEGEAAAPYLHAVKSEPQGLVTLNSRAARPDSELTTDPVRAYLNQVGRVDLLTAEQEVDLAKRIEAGVLAEAALTYAAATDADKELDLRTQTAARSRVYAQAVTAAERAAAEAADDREKQEAIEKGEEREAGEVMWQQRAEELAAKHTEGHVAQVIALAAGKAMVRGRAVSIRQQELEALAEDGKQAQQHMTEANLRLVVSIAKKYPSRGLTFLELVQEGNIGLMHAVEKFDYAKGYKFSTYSTWWIKQAITRSIADKGRIIRVPIHESEKVVKQERIVNELRKSGTEPSEEEIARHMNITVEKVRRYRDYARVIASLDQPIDPSGSGRLRHESTFGDFVAAEGSTAGLERVETYSLREELNDYLESKLDNERARSIVRLRLGLADGHRHSMDEIGAAFNISHTLVVSLFSKAIAELRVDPPETLREYL
jgi:RNA polymerase primary sigma factor